MTAFSRSYFFRREDVEDRFADQLVALVAEVPTGRLVDVGQPEVEIREKVCVRRQLDRLSDLRQQTCALLGSATQLAVGGLHAQAPLLHE